MTADALFTAANLAVLPFWVVMIFLPRWRVTEAVMGSVWVLVPLPAFYAVLLAQGLADTLPVLANPKLADVAAALGRPEGALVGWVHYLAFDLFVGRWEYLDGRSRRVNPWLMAPALGLTLLLGPVGLLTYLGVRWLAGRAPGVPAISP